MYVQPSKSIAVIVSLIGLLILAACGTSNRFHAEAWQHTDGTDPHDSTRCQMVDDLMMNYLHTGLSRAEVSKLIGQAEDTPIVHDLIGVCGVGVDYDYLELTFDAAEKLQAVCRIQG
jgi:hypothetical protein